MLDIAYQDESVLIVNKPKGMSVEPDGRGGSLVEAAREYCGCAYACHRLDAMTGGLVLIAKTRKARDEAFAMFRESVGLGVAGEDGGLVSKVYLCETVRAPKPSSGELAGYMIKDPKRARVRVYDRPVPGAKLARTLFHAVSSTAGGGCLVAARLLTGRTHQIRAQFAAAGWPILGDEKYGDWIVNRERRVRGQRLWAAGMSFGETRGLLQGLSGKEFWVRAPFAPGLDPAAVKRAAAFVMKKNC